MKAVAPWIPCPCCPEYLCTIHGKHAFACDCPTIDEWETDPYMPCTGSAPWARGRVACAPASRAARSVPISISRSRSRSGRSNSSDGLITMTDLGKCVSLERALLEEIAETLNRCDVQKWMICGSSDYGFYLAVCDDGDSNHKDMYFELFLRTGAYRISSPWFHGFHGKPCDLNDPESLTQQGLLRAVNRIRDGLTVESSVEPE